MAKTLIRTRWGFAVEGGLIDTLTKEYLLHEATYHYTLNPGVKENLRARNIEIEKQLDFLLEGNQLDFLLLGK